MPFIVTGFQGNFEFPSFVSALEKARELRNWYNLIGFYGTTVKIICPDGKVKVMEINGSITIGGELTPNQYDLTRTWPECV